MKLQLDAPAQELWRATLADKKEPTEILVDVKRKQKTSDKIFQR